MAVLNALRRIDMIDLYHVLAFHSLLIGSFPYYKAGMGDYIARLLLVKNRGSFRHGSLDGKHGFILLILHLHQTRRTACRDLILCDYRSDVVTVDADSGV